MPRRTCFFKDLKGGTLVEFAVVGPVFLSLIFAILESSTMLMANILLEGGVREAARFGITGRTDLGSRTTVIEQIIEEYSAGLLDPDNIQVSSEVYPSFDSIGSGEQYDDRNSNGRRDRNETYVDANGNGRFDDSPGVPGVGGSEDIVVYQVTYDWQLIVPFLRPLVSPDGTITLQAQVAVRNEPWSQQ